MPRSKRRSRDKQLLETVLEQVASGRISVAALLGEAMNAPAFRRWATAQIERAAEPRRLQLRRHERFDDAMIEKALRAAKAKFARHGVTHVAWGTAERAAHNEGEPCVILFVSNKIRPELLPRSSRLPKAIAVRHRGKTVSVPVDVQRMPRGRKEAGVVRPGNLSLAIAGDALGTLSAIVDASVVVSGHLVALDASVTGRFGSGDEVSLGTVTRRREDETVDAARIDGVNVQDIDFLSSTPREVRELASSDLNIRLTVHRAQGDGDCIAFVDGVEMPAEFDNDDGTTSRMVGLIKLSKKVSRSGDSGAPVLDDAKRLIGFVIGSANGNTYVIPARRVIDAMF